MNNTVNSRALLVEMLQEILSGKEYSHVVVRNVLNKYDYLPSVEKSFIKRVCEGTVERWIQIDYIIDSFSTVKVAKMKPVIATIMRMSVYQIMFMDQVPDSAACNEAVKLAGKRGFASLKGFVNGVLRNISRNKTEISYPDEKSNPVEAYAIRYSMPQWIVKKWMEEYGRDTTLLMLEDLLKEHSISVRMDENLTADEQKIVIESMKNKGIQVQNNPYLPYAFYLEKTEGMQQVPGFMEGKLNVMDTSSMLVVEVCGVKAGYQIIDMCSAPGGKALHMACKLNHTGNIDARDVNEYKISLIEENIARNPYKNIVAKVMDATVTDPDSFEQADIVLVDAPCSGLGVIGKKRDIKYHATEEGLVSLVELQKKILLNAMNYVKPGGVLVYSTCTINPGENEKNALWFGEQDAVTMESLNAYIPKELWCETSERGYLQLLPGVHKTDGFFMARFRKSK